MADPISIELTSGLEGQELIETLARKGLIGELIEAGDHWEVELRSSHEPTRRILIDLEPAVELWLADQPQRSITIRVGSRSYTLSRNRRSKVGQEVKRR